MKPPDHSWNDRLATTALFRQAPVLLVCLLVSLTSVGAADKSSSPQAPLKVLFITGGGYHDYEKLAPHLTARISELVNADFDVQFGLKVLRDPTFADKYAAVIYDVCDDEIPDESLDHALQSIQRGKPAVMIHCAVHAFRKSPKISEWETCCGMRSKVHDPFGPFTVTKLDPQSPITQFFPNDWKTPGDELYQTIAINPKSHQLLKAKSPRDGREHVVCWTYQAGQGRVFATTLGHDMATAGTPEYLRLVANGLLWACGHLEPDGKAAAGYSGRAAKP